MAASGCVPKLKDLVYELKGVDWHKLGVQLDVPDHTLKNIDREHPSEDRKLSEVLQYWLKNGEASWKVIMKALKRIGGHGDIIKTIESDYIPSPVTKPTTSPKATDSESADSARLTEDEHHLKLINQLGTHAARWREIGTHLGFQQGELDAIQANVMLMSQAPLSYLNALLSKWYQWAPNDGRGSKDYARLGALKKSVSQAGLGVTADELTVL